MLHAIRRSGAVGRKEGGKGETHRKLPSLLLAGMPPRSCVTVNRMGNKLAPRAESRLSGRQRERERERERGERESRNECALRMEQPLVAHELNLCRDRARP